MSTRKLRFSPGVALGDQVVKCIWMMSGTLDYRLCDRGYDCENCPFDQALHAHRTVNSSAFRGATSDPSRKNRMLKTSKADEPMAETHVGSFQMATGLFYHPNHFWARVEGGGRLRFGLDDFAQKLFGRLYAVKLPKKGSRINPAEACLRLAFCSGEVPLAVPFAGIIDQINERLDQQPSLVNHAPYSQGWLAVVQPDGLSEGLREMLYGQEAKDWLPHEASKLNQVVAKSLEAHRPEVGTTLQDGGVEVQDLAKIVGPSQHLRIMTLFFGGWIKEGRT